VLKKVDESNLLPEVCVSTLALPSFLKPLPLTQASPPTPHPNGHHAPQDASPGQCLDLGGAAHGERWTPEMCFTPVAIFLEAGPKSGIFPILIEHNPCLD
jgi:hypothetical protein